MSVRHRHTLAAAPIVGDMSLEILRSAALSHGPLLTTAYVGRLGVSGQELARLRRRGGVLPVARATWLVPQSHTWLFELAEETERLGAVVSHGTAAMLQGVPVLSSSDVPQLTVGRNRSRVQSHAELHRADVPADQVVHLRLRAGETLVRLRATRASRFAVELARTQEVTTAVAATDAALRLRLLTPAGLAGVRTNLWGRDAGRVGHCLGMVDPLSGSVLESVFRVIVVLAGMPPTASQYLLYGMDGRRIGRVDFWYALARLVVELEGDLYHRGTRLGEDERRSNAISALRYALLRFSWQHVFGDPDYVLGAVSDLVR